MRHITIESALILRDRRTAGTTELKCLAGAGRNIKINGCKVPTRFILKINGTDGKFCEH